jgi:hypothetical protein
MQKPEHIIRSTKKATKNALKRAAEMRANTKRKVDETQQVIADSKALLKRINRTRKGRSVR